MHLPRRRVKGHTEEVRASVPLYNRECRTTTTAQMAGTPPLQLLLEDLLVGANRCVPASQADPDPAASVPRAQAALSGPSTLSMLSGSLIEHTTTGLDFAYLAI